MIPDYLLDQLKIQANFPVKGGLLLAQKLLENLKAGDLAHGILFFTELQRRIVREHLFSH